MIFLYTGITSSGSLVGVNYPLVDTISCIVTEERNGRFDLVMTYPIGSAYSDMLIPDAIILATPRPNSTPQPFRISEIEQVIEGIVTVRANHIVYDLDGWGLLRPNEIFDSRQGITTVLTSLNNLMFASPYSMFEAVNVGISNTTTIVEFGNTDYASVFAIIGKVAEAFNAELKYEWDASTGKCTVSFCAARGTAKPTIISYGVNIISLDRKLDYSTVYSTVYAYWLNPDPQGLIRSAAEPAQTGYTARTRCLYINYTDKYGSTEPQMGQLGADAQKYIDTHGLSPSNSLTVAFVPTGNTTDYQTGLARVGSAVVGVAIIGNLIDNSVLYLCDTATVDASLIGVSATAKCVKVIYNVITEMYDAVTVGTIQDDIVDTILKIGG